MKIESNILGVMDRMKRLQRAVPVALARTLEPDPWLPEATAMAARALNAVAKPSEVQYIPLFITYASEFANGFKFTMRSPFRSALSLADVAAARANMGGFDDMFRNQVDEFEDLLTDWVADVKKHTHKDAGKTDREIAEFISYALLTPDGQKLVVKSGKNKGKLVSEMFTPHIEKYIAGQTAVRQLSAAVVHNWLVEVLAAWRQLVRVRLPQRFFGHLKTARSEL